MIAPVNRIARNRFPGSSLFSQTPPPLSLVLTVIVPVRNESFYLTKTLDSLRRQHSPNGTDFDSSKYEVLLLANNCTDRSFEIAKAYQHKHPRFALHVARIQLPRKKANIGNARRILMDEAYQRLMSVGKPEGIIASTDGDTRVHPTWVHHIVHEIKKGNDAVGGRILVSRGRRKPGKYHGLDETYRNLIARVESIVDPLQHDPWPRHFQFFGANLAVTCKMYERAGRLPQEPYLEDEAFHRALSRKDAKIRKSRAVKVTTSNRRIGRVSVGLSEQLKKWECMEKRREPQIVCSAREIITRLTLRRRLRRCWIDFHADEKCASSSLARIAKKMGVDVIWLEAALHKKLYFGQLWETVENKMRRSDGKKWKPALITSAIRELRRFVSDHRDAS